MATAKIAISIDDRLVKKVDTLVKKKIFANRSKAIQEAVREKLNRLEKSRLAEECAKLVPEFEQSMAEESLSEEIGSWPEY